MEKPLKYVIFRTEWGYFGSLGTDNGLHRTCLPTPTYEQTEKYLLQSTPLAQFDPSFFQNTQKRVVAYFRGAEADLFQEVLIDLCGLTPFQIIVLKACRRIARGKTTTYGELAEKIGKPEAARAVGNALARNPLPLIIPCHRILAANNHLGGFSAPGGTILKERMLRHEQKCRR